jgi:hypothetical protein
MPLPMRPGESSPPSGPSGNSEFPTKAQKLFLRHLPSLPTFPLTKDDVAAVADRPGPLPTTMEQFMQTVSADRQRQQAAKQPAPMPAAPMPQAAPEAMPMSGMAPPTLPGTDY